MAKKKNTPDRVRPPIPGIKTIAAIESPGVFGVENAPFLCNDNVFRHGWERASRGKVDPSLILSM